LTAGKEELGLTGSLYKIVKVNSSGEVTVNKHFDAVLMMDDAFDRFFLLDQSKMVCLPPVFSSGCLPVEAALFFFFSFSFPVTALRRLFRGWLVRGGYFVIGSHCGGYLHVQAPRESAARSARGQPVRPVQRAQGHLPRHGRQTLR